MKSHLVDNMIALDRQYHISIVATVRQTELVAGRAVEAAVAEVDVGIDVDVDVPVDGMEADVAAVAVVVAVPPFAACSMSGSDNEVFIEESDLCKLINLSTMHCPVAFVSTSTADNSIHCQNGTRGRGVGYLKKTIQTNGRKNETQQLPTPLGVIAVWMDVFSVGFRTQRKPVPDVGTNHGGTWKRTNGMHRKVACASTTPHVSSLNANPWSQLFLP